MKFLVLFTAAIGAIPMCIFYFRTAKPWLSPDWKTLNAFSLVLVTLGILSNGIVIFANDFRMPVREDAHVIPALVLLTSAEEHSECMVRYRDGENLGWGCDTMGISENMDRYYAPISPDTELLELSDVIFVLLPFRFIALGSLGDLMIVIGSAVFIITSFIKPPRP